MFSFFTIAFLIFVSAAEIDICVASLPQIMHEFKISAFQTELVLGLNLLTHSVFAFFAGILGKKYGNKSVINFGMILFIFSSFLCYFAKSYELILLGRTIQGIGAAMPAVLAQLFVFSNFEKNRHEDIMSKLNGVCTLGIASAPIIGSIIILYKNWRFNFLFLGIIGIIAQILFNISTRREEKKQKKEKFNLTTNLKIITKSKITLISILTCSIGIAAYYSFLGMSSMIYVDSLGVNIKTFGIYQAVSTLAFGIFSIINGNLVSRFGKKNMFYFSFSLISIFLIGISIFLIFNLKNSLVLLFLMVIWAIGAVHPVNLLYTRSINSIPSLSSIVAGLLTVFKWMFSIIGFQLASYFYDKTLTSTAIVIIIFYAFYLTGYTFLIRSNFLKLKS